LGNFLVIQEENENGNTAIHEISRTTGTFFGSVMMVHADIPHPLTVDFPASLHFLTPGGEDVVLPAGMYQVEVAESWLKLLPEGLGRTEAVLLEATPLQSEVRAMKGMVKEGQKFEHTDMPVRGTVNHPVLIHPPQTIAFSK
jgi:hypothetical protein